MLSPITTPQSIHNIAHEKLSQKTYPTHRHRVLIVLSRFGKTADCICANMYTAIMYPSHFLMCSHTAHEVSTITEHGLGLEVLPTGAHSIISVTRKSIAKQMKHNSPPLPAFRVRLPA